jgi:hypothetical protein
MNFPGPGKGKSKSDMPKKAGKQCATTGKCKVEGASKVSMRDAQKERLRVNKLKQDKEDEYERKNRGKVVPKFKTNASYGSGGMVHKKGRGAESSEWKSR